MDLEIKTIDEKLDQRFNEVNRRIQEVNRQFQEADTRMRLRFDHMQKASRNSLRTRGWEEIYPVGSYNATGGVNVPDHFPRTVKQFWGLKDP